MEELKKIKKSNIRIIIAMILIIFSSIGVIITYNRYLEEEREREKESSTIYTETANFNSKFACMAGQYKTAAVVRGLCTNVITNNSAYEDDESRRVFIKVGDISQLHTREEWKSSGAYYKAEDIAKLRDRIFSIDRYNIELCYENITGQIMGIGITKVGGIENSTNETINTIKPLGNIE